jgi:hypothetical protein
MPILGDGRIIEAEYYTPADIARVVGQEVTTIRAFLRWRYPGHHARSWWRLSEAEYSRVLRELRVQDKARKRGCIRRRRDG